MKPIASPRLPAPRDQGGGQLFAAPTNSLGADLKPDPNEQMSWMVLKIFSASGGVYLLPQTRSINPFAGRDCGIADLLPDGYCT